MYITVKEYIDAIEKNGLPQVRSNLFRTNVIGRINGACALGQAVINLGIEVVNLDIPIKPDEAVCTHSNSLDLQTATIHLSDYHQLSLVEIVSKLRESFASSMDKKFRATKKDYSEEIDMRVWTS